MFCIAAFIVFAILAIFSATYRPLAAKAWHCVLRRITFRPCDINFGAEMKGKIIGKLIFSHPRLARFLNRWIDWLSCIFVMLSIWSILDVLQSGLNLWVYDTCNPQSAESCSLSGEACGVEQQSLGFAEAIRAGRVGEWMTAPAVQFFETLSRIPDRLKTWQPQEFLSPTATFYRPRDEGKPYGLEIIDPSCTFCKKLTRHMVEAGALENVNVSYLLYPIPSSATGGYKFPHSFLMSSFIEASKRVPRSRGDNAIAPDWQLIERIFEGTTDDPELQSRFAIGMTRLQAYATLLSLLADIGYTQEEVDRIEALASSEEVLQSLAEQRAIVEERIRTIKIPTLLLGGRRFDRVIAPANIKNLIQGSSD